MNGLVSQRLLYGGNENISIGQPVNETLVVKLCNFEEPSLYVENIYLVLVAIFAVSLLVAAIDFCPRNIIIRTFFTGVFFEIFQLLPPPNFIFPRTFFKGMTLYYRCNIVGTNELIRLK